MHFTQMSDLESEVQQRLEDEKVKKGQRQIQ